MATKRRKRRRNSPVSRRATHRGGALMANPRRRRRRTRRNPTTIVARSSRRVINPRRRRRISRRRQNPTAMHVGGIVKDMIYGAGGAILTRAASTVAEGLVPGQFAASPFMRPVVQAAVAVVPVRWFGNKFLGKAQGDKMMIGGLISAGLALADALLPNVQGQITNIFRAPLSIGAAVAPAQGVAGFADVYDVAVLPGSFGPTRGFGDVEDVPMDIFS